ncbi:hypothetical protein [Fictibacillus terranigra]|uniref:Uncharacterized protein n=1 Tax=Fictibacillus terranigra TaxID=3058424 RepID=A0ABT8E2W5_9BACL|nr:hypothetical protein [Fictibacillus sp. CENA-BCM004]MDN4072263.1 hypothetical protein [Fictibacillus sp. CENA-BCM004]
MGLFQGVNNYLEVPRRVIDLTNIRNKRDDILLYGAQRAQEKIGC